MDSFRFSQSDQTGKAENVLFSEPVQGRYHLIEWELSAA